MCSQQSGNGRPFFPRLTNQLTSHFFGHQNSPTRANLRNLPPLPHPPPPRGNPRGHKSKSKLKKNGARKSKTFPIHYYLLGLIWTRASERNREKFRVRPSEENPVLERGGDEKHFSVLRPTFKKGVVVQSKTQTTTVLLCTLEKAEISALVGFNLAPLVAANGTRENQLRAPFGPRQNQPKPPKFGAENSSTKQFNVCWLEQLKLGGWEKLRRLWWIHVLIFQGN